VHECKVEIKRKKKRKEIVPCKSSDWVVSYDVGGSDMIGNTRILWREVVIYIGLVQAATQF